MALRKTAAIMVEALRQHTFLLAGFGSEYTLQPIERYLRDLGFAVLACDMQRGPLPPLPTTPTIFISSQHPSCSSYVFRYNWGQETPYSNYVGTLEIIECLRPVCSVLVPHDLETPIRSDELVYMGAFDIYCSPTVTVNPRLNHCCRPIFTGWIKHNDFDPLSPELSILVADRGVFFLNQVVNVMRAGGAAFIRERYPQLFSEGPLVKLPAWPGSKSLGEALAQLGAAIIPDHLSSTKLIAASSRVFINAPGSVTAEASYLGKPVVFLDGTDSDIPAIAPAKPQMEPAKFDFESLLSAVGSHIKERNA